MKLITQTQVTVDGVMQGNGGASDEDRISGFERGGWAMGVFDDEHDVHHPDLPERRRVPLRPADLRGISLMDMSEREAMAKAIIDGNSYMTLGTADAAGVPWASPVWYAPASYREYFWVSRPSARHSQNIAVRPQVGVVIFDSTVPISTGKAVYMAALAKQVTDDGEIARGMSVFSERALAQGGRAWTPEEVGPSGRVRLYRAWASEQFVLSPEDERLPLMLE